MIVKEWCACHNYGHCVHEGGVYMSFAKYKPNHHRIAITVDLIWSKLLADTMNAGKTIALKHGFLRLAFLSLLSLIIWWYFGSCLQNSALCRV